jgi:hypothetical protein
MTGTVEASSGVIGLEDAAEVGAGRRHGDQASVGGGHEAHQGGRGEPARRPAGQFSVGGHAQPRALHRLELRGSMGAGRRPGPQQAAVNGHAGRRPRRHRPGRADQDPSRQSVPARSRALVGDLLAQLGDELRRWQISSQLAALQRDRGA